MPVYNIANLHVYMEPVGALLQARAEKYRTDAPLAKEACDIVIDGHTEGFLAWREKYRDYSFDANEYAWFGYRFYSALLQHGGFFLHASAVALDGTAYLFSADSGIGKSTHTKLWTEHFGTDRTKIINDDKPAILCKDGAFYAFGTPFSGKNDLSADIGLPVGALCFLERCEQNYIEKIDGRQAIARIFKQIIHSGDRAFMETLLAMLDGFLCTVPVYLLRCNVSCEAVITAYNAMCGQKNDKI